MSFLIPKKISLLGNNQKLLFLRGMFGVIAMSLFYKTLQIMPIGTAVSLRYISPIFAAILAIIFLKEKVRSLQWLCFLSALVGVFLLKGFDTRVSSIAIALALLTALFSSVVYVLLRKIGKSEHPLVIVNYFMVMALVIGGLSSIGTWVTPKGNEWFILLMLGIFGFGGQLYMTKAFQLAETNLIAPFKYTEVIFTVLFGWFLYGEYQSIATIGAMGLIVLSLLANVWVKRKA